MLKFAIKNEYYKGKTIGYLYYDEQNRTYEIEIPENVKSFEAPFITQTSHLFIGFKILIKQGFLTVYLVY